jgi:flagellin-specific chaperone FliS
MVIGALEACTRHGEERTQDNEEKLMTLTAQVVEDILEKEVQVKKEVTTTRETLQNFMEAWKGMTQQA